MLSIRSLLILPFYPDDLCGSQRIHSYAAVPLNYPTTTSHQRQKVGSLSVRGFSHSLPQVSPRLEDDRLSQCQSTAITFWLMAISLVASA